MCIYMNRETTNQLNSQWEGGRVLPSVVTSQTMASISLGKQTPEQPQNWIFFGVLFLKK